MLQICDFAESATHFRTAAPSATVDPDASATFNAPHLESRLVIRGQAACQE